MQLSRNNFSKTAARQYGFGPFDRLPHLLAQRLVFVKILQKNWLGVFLPLKNLSRGFAPTLRYPRIFFNMNRRLLVLCFLYYARAVQGGIPMTANVNRNGSVRLRGAISLSG